MQLSVNSHSTKTDPPDPPYLLSANENSCSLVSGPPSAAPSPKQSYNGETDECHHMESAFFCGGGSVFIKQISNLSIRIFLKACTQEVPPGQLVVFRISFLGRRSQSMTDVKVCGDEVIYSQSSMKPEVRL
jgi:hypothetical protein